MKTSNCLLGYYILRISLLRLSELLVREPYNKIRTWFFALKLRKFGSTFSRFSKRKERAIIRITN